MKSKKPRNTFSKRNKPEVLNLSPFGMWLLIDQKEYFVDFSNYPWFKEATLEEISNVESGFGTGIYWPDLDIDVALEALDHPERFPLKANLKMKKKSSKRVKVA